MHGRFECVRRTRLKSLVEKMTSYLQRLERDLASLLRNQREHDCIWELTGVCPQCETSWIKFEQLGERIREEKAFLPGYYEAQTKQRTAYVCKDMVRPLATSLDDRIVALAMLINA